MQTIKEMIQQIQGITFEAYKASGQAAALLGEPSSPPEAMVKALEQTAANLEQGTVELRTLCESCLPELLTIGRKPVLPPLDVAGSISVNEFGWLLIELNTLLPHCRFSSPVWLTDTITRLLDRHERSQGKLPMLDRALLVIEEFCDVDSRNVFDQDNKGWKAVSNAIKGRLVKDDDQFTLSVCLLSQRFSGAKACHIYVLPLSEAGDFFSMRSDCYSFSR